MDNNNTCSDQSKVENWLPRIILMVNGDIGLFIASLVLLTLFYDSAFKTFLQRLFVYLVVTVLISNLCNSFAYYHEQLNSKSELACEFLAFFEHWSMWCIYVFLVVMILHLLVIICLKIFRDVPSVSILKKQNQVFLEVVITLACIGLPVLILCLPYYQNKDAYGYNDVICAAKTRGYWGSYLAISVHSDIAGGIAAVVAVGMTIIYCARSDKLQHAKAAIWTLIILVYIVAFFGITHLVASQVLNELGFCRVPIMLAMTGVLFDIFLLAYFLAFQSRRFCEPLKKIVKKKRDSSNNLLNHRNSTIEKGTAAESNRESMPSYTHFNNSTYTGAFTTISTTT